MSADAITMTPRTVPRAAETPIQDLGELVGAAVGLEAVSLGGGELLLWDELAVEDPGGVVGGFEPVKAELEPAAVCRLVLVKDSGWEIVGVPVAVA